MNRKFKGLQNRLIQKKKIHTEYLRKQYQVFDLITRAELLVTVHGLEFIDSTLEDDQKWNVNNLQWILLVTKPFSRLIVTHETLLLIVAGVQDHLYQLKVHRGQQEVINKNDNDNKDTNNSCYSPSCHSSSSTSIKSFSCDDLYEVSTALEEK